MTLSGEQVLLRIYLHSADRAPHTPTYERILKAAREQRLAGATVIKGIMGSGHAGVIQQSGSMWTVVEHVPVIVEIVDSAPAIGRFIESSLAQLLIHGMATLERAHVLVYRHSQSPPTPPLRLAGPVSPLSTLPLLQARSRMAINEDGVLLRVLIGESDRWQHQPLYQAIVKKYGNWGWPAQRSFAAWRVLALIA